MMLKSALKMMAATAAFAVVHSFLATRSAKHTAARVFGERRRNAFYRAFYNGQSLVTFALLGLYARSLPDRTLYEVRGPARWLMQGSRLAACALAVHTARQVGALRMMGVTEVREFLQGAENVHPEPEAQGPALASDGQMKITGAFRNTRHPMNFAPLPILLLKPKMTVRLAAFAGASAVYFLLGSLHEESRLAEAYGDTYQDYRYSNVSFYLPVPEPKSMDQFSEANVDRRKFGTDTTESLRA